MMTLDEAMKLQELIDSGMAWRLEGHTGRACHAAIVEGHCMLGEKSHTDYWGQFVPSRFDVEPGTLGSRGYFEARQDQLEYEASFEDELDDDPERQDQADD